MDAKVLSTVVWRVEGGGWRVEHEGKSVVCDGEEVEGWRNWRVEGSCCAYIPTWKFLMRLAFPCLAATMMGLLEM